MNDDGASRIHRQFEQAYNAGDLAYLSTRWSLQGTNPDGEAFEIGAVTAGVTPRQPDGTWLYVIDNVWGEQHTDSG